MIVGVEFADDCLEVARRQHDAYASALEIIICECKASTRKAAYLLGVKPPDCAVDENHIDHRTLQRIHDLLAAAWRYRSGSSEPRLALAPTPPPQTVTAGGKPFAQALPDEWRVWLADEVRSWRDEPGLIRYVMLIMQHQWSDLGQKAENSMIAALYDRFDDVPWAATRRKAHQDATEHCLDTPPSLQAARSTS